MSCCDAGRGPASMPLVCSRLMHICNPKVRRRDDGPSFRECQHGPGIDHWRQQGHRTRNDAPGARGRTSGARTCPLGGGEWIVQREPGENSRRRARPPGHRRGTRRHRRRHPGSGRLFPGRSIPAGQSLLRRDPRSGQRHGRPGREAADRRHRLWRRRQPRQHQLPATTAVSDGVRPRLCRQVRAGTTDQGQFARLDDCPTGSSDERPANRALQDPGRAIGVA